MQIKFLTIYGSPIHGDTITNAQADLLEFWQKSVLNSQMPIIKTAKVSFNDFSFSEFYDQERLKNEIRKSVYSGYDHESKSQYWQLCGKKYYVFDELYNELKETHRLLELAILPSNDYN